MEYKTLYKDTKIPVIGIGTWTIGGRLEADYSKDKESTESIRRSIELGYTHIDTAESYGGGHCEELVGKSIEGIDRKKLFITTKVTNTNLRYNDLIDAARRSLERLKTDYIDLYLIHAPNSQVPIEETMRALDFLVAQKTVRFIGVSNFTVQLLKEAQEYSKNKIVANQIEYNLMTRNKGRYANNINMESQTIPHCQKNGIVIIAERPIERGVLTKRHHVLDELSIKYDKTRAQIAINWLICKENMITIPKSTNINHLKENLGAIGWKLDRKDIKLLDSTDFKIPA